MRSLLLAFAALTFVACDHSSDTVAPVAPPQTIATTPTPGAAATTKTTSATSMPRAEVGQPAPDFTLPDLDGHSVHLADFKGKLVVLEWFNPGCPFVKKSHTKGGLVTTPKRYLDQGVVWLAVNSAAAGKEGNGLSRNAEAKHALGMDYPVLLDESGDVGRAYGATNTPHMFVIDKAGTLVYRGAIDNSPDAEGESPTSGKVVNYVDATMGDLAAGRPVAVASTQAYGCGVKYARP